MAGDGKGEICRFGWPEPIWANDLRLHAVTGCAGPPLLLVHGWPQTWYAWRMLMPALARDSVVPIDQRGIGLSDKPTGCS